MTNKEFISQIAKQTGYKVDDVHVQRIVRTTFSSIADELVEGETANVTGLGTFEVRKRMERVIKNPSTGQKMLVPPKLVVNFKPYGSLKEMLK